MKSPRIGLMLVAVVSTAAMQSPVPPETAHQAVPRFEAGPCPIPVGDWARAVRIECGSLIVAQDRAQPNGRTFRLAVVIARPPQPATELPVVHLHGGPSGPGGIRSGLLEWFARQKDFNRDVVVWDIRGAGLSEPPLDALCANLSVERCVPKLKAEGIDPTTFNSAVNADDLRDLRRTLGYERWNLVGGSYGSRLAQEAMRRDPQGVHLVVTSAPLPVGSYARAELPRTFQTVIERVFVSCASQPVCAAAYPNLEADFYSVYDRLNANPIEVSIPRLDGPLRVVFDGARFMRTLRQRFNNMATDVPLVVHELARGDRVGAARRLIGDGSPPGSDNTLTNLVGCYDQFGPKLAEMQKPIAAQVKLPFRRLEYQAGEAECGARRERRPPAGYDELVSTAIPTLIFGAEFDDRTPTHLGRLIASQMEHAYVFEIPGVLHGGGLISDCALAIAARFAADPLKAPDASCLATMPKMAFELPESGPPTLTLAIASDASSVFAGRWQAAFGGSIEYAVNLQIERGQITGAIETTDLTVPIRDGHADNSEIRFSVTSPSGERVIRFVGILEGDRILFAREVDVRPGGSPGGAALFGAASRHWFTARRVK